MRCARYLGLAALAATLVSFDAQALVINQVLFPSWTTFNGGGTTKVTGPGDQVTLTTSVNTGIWFGKSGSNPAVPIGSATSGNYLSLTTNLTSTSSRDWIAYIYDTSGYYAALNFNTTAASPGSGGPGCNASVSNCYLAPIISGLRVDYADPGNVFRGFDYSLDPSLQHTYEILLSMGQVTYRVDGNTIFTGQAFHNSMPPVGGALLIGDITGTSRSGTGGMRISALTFNNAPSFSFSSVPAPAAAALLGFGLIVLTLRRRA